MSSTFQFPQEAGAQDFPQGFCAAGFLPERNVTTFDCHASQPVAPLDPSILEESEQWILGSWQVAVANFVVLKISEQTRQMQLRFLNQSRDQNNETYPEARGNRTNHQSMSVASHILVNR